MKKIVKTAGEVAALVEGRLEGDSSFKLDGIAGLPEAGPTDLSFLGNPKYADAAKASKAGCILLPPWAKDLKCRAACVIRVEDPQYAFSRLLAYIDAQKPKPAPGVSAQALVHPEARLGRGASIGAFSVVSKGADIGDETVVGPQCYIGENAFIGSRCLLHPQVVVREDCVLGSRVIVHSGAVVGADGFGFSTDPKTGKHRKIPQIGNAVVGDDVEIGANVTIDRATFGSTVVGSGTKIDNLVQIAHNVKVGKDCILVSQSGIAGSSVLEDRVILAGQAGVAGHLRIGEGAVVMAQAGVMSDVGKGEKMFDSPARPRREAMRLQAIYGRLPEIYDAVKKWARAGGKKEEKSAS